MLQKQSDDLTILVYDNPKSPKCLKFNKKALRFFLLFLPLLVTASLLITSYILANLKRIRLENELKQPQIITELKDEIKLLESNIGGQKVEIDSLINKISKGSTSSNEDNVSLINLPLGYNNFTAKMQAGILEEKNTVLPSGTQFNFKLANNLTNQKLSGYIFVIRITNNSFEVWPKSVLGVKDEYRVV